MGERALHRRERRFRAADFVVAAARRDDARALLRALAEGDDARREPPHRSDHHPPQRRPQHARHHRREDQRDGQESARNPPHRFDQPRLIERDVDQRAVALRAPDDPDERAGLGEQRAEGGLIALHHRGIAEFVSVADRRLIPRSRDQPALVRQRDDDGLGADAVEDFRRQLLGQRFVGRIAEEQHRGMGHHQAVAQPVVAVGGKARGVDQPHRQQHEADRQQQQTARQSERAAAGKRDRRRRADRFAERSLDRTRRRLRAASSCDRTDMLVFPIDLNDLGKIRFGGKAEAERAGWRRTGSAIPRRCARWPRRAGAGSISSPLRPRAARSASICSPTVAETPGIVRLRRAPSWARSRSPHGGGTRPPSAARRASCARSRRPAGSPRGPPAARE